jgi:glycosyltransferase involved in cell wall biosynthesis/tetratricopeptide (TPR) repeat protein/SAM-dependent methyltransferase
MKPLAQYQEHAVAKFFGLLPARTKRILEIGSDVEYAVVDNIAARFGGTVTGINPKLGFVKRSPQDGPPNVEIMEADGCDMPFDDQSFDAILTIATMEHVHDVAKFLEESHRVLRPGGVFYTNFSPIWSCGIGHHVCAFAGRKEARFWKPDRNPLPDFSHLLWSEEEMREYLLYNPCDDRLIEPIIDWVYRSGDINRYFYEDYLEAFRGSRLKVSSFVTEDYKSPSPDLLEALRAKHGRQRAFSHNSIESTLIRTSLSHRPVREKNYATSLQLPAAEARQREAGGASPMISQGTDIANVVIYLHRGNQGSAEKLLKLLLAVDEGIDCIYHLQYGDHPETLAIMETIACFETHKKAVLHFDLPDIMVPAEFVENDPNLAEYPGNQVKGSSKQKHSILRWNLCVYKFIQMLDSFLLLEPDCVILKERWLSDIHRAAQGSNLPVFGHLVYGQINGSPMPTHWAGCSLYNGRKLRELDLERYFYERYENPWWRLRNLPGTTIANNCFYGPAFSGYDIAYDYFLFTHYWRETTGISDPFQWPLQKIESRDDLIQCDFNSTLTAEEICDRFRDKLPVLLGVRDDDSRVMITKHFTDGGSSAMSRPTAHNTAADNAIASAGHVKAKAYPPPHRLSPEELLVLTNRKLCQFRDRHKGERCVIIGNGPSLNKMDLSFLENEITFGMNRIFLLFDKWKFRPTYYVSVNPLVIEQSAAEILQIDAPKFLSHKGIPFFDDPGDIHFLRSIPQWFFSKDPRNGICEGWTVTFVAMQLAYFMGFSEVILIGVDHHFETKGEANKEVVSEGDDPNHFHPGYFGKGTRWHLPDLEHSEGSYRMAKEAFESDTRRILDATVDGKLTIFPRVDYREKFYMDHSLPAAFVTNAHAIRESDSAENVDASSRIHPPTSGHVTNENKKHGRLPVPVTLAGPTGSSDLSGDRTGDYNTSQHGQSPVSKSPRISVVTPTLNQARFLVQTIRSVTAQNYPNYEHIVIDGGSGDDTVEILKRHPHVRWLSEKDRGQSDALNKGFRMATGDIIAWINSDDWYEPGTFSLIADFFQEHPDRNIVMGNCNLVDKHGYVFDTVVNNERGFYELKQHWVPRSIPTQPAVFFRRRLLDEFGQLDESLHYAMDYDLWMRFAQKNRLYHIDRTVANYRFHSDAKGGDQDWTKFLPDCNAVYRRYCKPIVSVVIPCFNYARYLSDAVMSVINQTFQGFEIIIVNDGSSDNTKEVANKLISAYTNYGIRLINQANSGDPALARNRGIREACGEFILCLDADDLIMPEFLLRCVTQLSKEQDIAIAYTDQVYFGTVEARVVRVAEYDINRLAEANFMGYCSLFRKKVWEEVGGYPSGIGYEDWDFWLSCGEKGHYGRRIPLPLFCYRQHGSGRYAQDMGRDAEIKARIAQKHPALYSDRARREAGRLIREGGENVDSASDRTFRVIALISAHNEGDVICHVIGDLVRQGIDVYLINHCSTDNTAAEASRWLGKGLLHIENFPQDAGYPVENTTQYIWHHILRRKEELAAQLDADWFIHSDADEFRESPWPELTLKQAIQVADRMGYNAIDFELLNFRPVNNSFAPGTDVREALRHYEGGEDFNACQIKAWKNLHVPVSISKNGGHDITFPDRSVFPVKFMLRHYPIRSQSHGERKVFLERKNRFNDEERKVGWHVQYDDVRSERHNFLYSPATLTLYDGDKVRLRILSAQALAIADDISKNEKVVMEYGTQPVSSSINIITGHDQTSDTQDFLGQANTLANGGNYAEAVRCFKQVLVADPGNCRALVGIGVAKLLEGDHTEAVLAFSEAIKSNPKDSRALCGMGMARFSEGRARIAINYLKKSLDADPENLTALHELVKCAYHVGKYDEAEAYLERYLMYQPGNCDILFSLAGILYKTEKLDKALKQLERLQVLSPGYQGGKELLERINLAKGVICTPQKSGGVTLDEIDGLAAQGAELKKAGKFIEAFETFSRVREMGYPSVISDMGDCRANMGDYHGAEALFQAAMQVNQDDLGALVGLGVVSMLQENMDKAASFFNQALRADKANVKALTGLGMVRKSQGKSQEAFSRFASALKADPDNLVALHEMLKTAYELNRITEAEEYLVGYLMYHPADSHILFSLAGLRHRLGKHVEALDSLERILAFEPGYEGGAELAEQIRTSMSATNCHYQATSHSEPAADIFKRANTLAGEGKIGEAATLYQQALAADPDDCRALIGMGVLNLLEMNHSQAADYFTKALKGTPSDTKALCGLGMAQADQGKIKEGMELFCKALDADQENLTALGELIKCAYRLELFPEAERHLDNYLRHHPADLDMLFSQAGIQFRVGKYADALDNIEKLLIFAPGYEGGRELKEKIESMPGLNLQPEFQYRFAG